MKKLFVVALAALGMVACVNEDVVETPKSDAIAFAQVYVDNAVRAAAVDPSFAPSAKNELKSFDVWAFMDGAAGTVLADEDVTKVAGTQDEWTYTNVQYWFPGHDYYFAAVAPVCEDWKLEALAEGGDEYHGLGTISFENKDGGLDLLYATQMVSTKGKTLEDIATHGMDAVKLDFAHLLSKVKFTFQNGFKTANADIVVKNIQMVAPATGEIDLATDKVWNLGEETVTLAFGDVERLNTGAKEDCADERLTIPATAEQTYEITFDVEVYVGGDENGGGVHAMTTTLKSAVAGVALEMGKAYNFFAEITPETLDLQKIEFSVSVQEWDYETTDVEHPVVATLNGEPYTSLQAALDATTVGENNITLITDIKSNVTVLQAEGKNITIDGNGKKYDGVITINGDARAKGAETLVIKNVNFATAGSYDSFIYAPTKINGRYNYSHNVTIENCTFDGNATTNAAKFQTTYNLVVKNCVATNVYSFIQVSSTDNEVVIEGVTTTGKNGIALGNAAKATLKDITINATAYGVRADGSRANSELVVETSTINAVQPIIVRKNSAAYKVTVDAATVLNTEEYYGVVFTTGDDAAAYVAPAAANYSYNVPADVKIYPVHAQAVDNDTLKAILTAGDASIIEVGEDITLDAAQPWANFNHEVTLEGNGHTLNVGDASNYGVFCRAGSDVTFNDANIVSKGGAVAILNANATFNSGSVVINSTSTSSRYNFYVSEGTLTINGGEFSFEAYRQRSYVYAYNSTVYIKGGEFGAAPNHPRWTNPFYLDGTSQLIITGGTFGFDPSAWVATGYKATKSGSTWTVAAE